MKKYFYRIILSYSGQSYFGWQIQNETEDTIQGKFNSAFLDATGINNFRTTGAGRTDSGVHAIGQVVLVETTKQLPQKVFLKGVNDRLPKDIRIIDADNVSEDFHPIFSSRSKTYQYVLALNILPPMLELNFLPYSKSINIELLQEGVECFRGKHDFQNYFCVGTDVSSTVREVFAASAKIIDNFSFGEYSVKGTFFQFEFTGSGFLKQQVRLMVGALLSLNEGRVTVSELRDSLLYRNARHLGSVAPARGLYLREVQY